MSAIPGFRLYCCTNRTWRVLFEPRITTYSGGATSPPRPHRALLPTSIPAPPTHRPPPPSPSSQQEAGLRFYHSTLRPRARCRRRAGEARRRRSHHHWLSRALRRRTERRSAGEPNGPPAPGAERTGPQRRLGLRQPAGPGRSPLTRPPPTPASPPPFSLQCLDASGAPSSSAKPLEVGHVGTPARVRRLFEEVILLKALPTQQAPLP